MNEIGSPSRLQAALGGQYAIERELGHGGMSRTFVARDVTLDRRVVIKVLPPDLAATVSHDRFRREILLSASLQHPNIVGILTAGEVDGLPYFTMPFVDGESLRMRLQRNGPLSVAQTVSILRDVARALAYAHSRQVVHRDIKPDNVLLTSGAAVVADFGVAKALSSARTSRHRGDDDATITTQGTTLGTPAYMAPEQAAGDPDTDHRADLYAFGVMAYEMLTGSPPFSGRTPAQLLAAHISEQPVHIAAERKDVPRALADLVMRCLEKEPDRRPQNASEVALALEDPAMVSGAFASAQTATVTGMRAARVRSWVWRSLAAVVVIGVVAVGIAQMRSGARQEAPPAAVDARSIAVLPLVNLSTDSSDAYLASGITDELASALSRVGKFRVASRTAAQAAQTKGASPQDIGKDLNVAYLLEGTVQRQGERVRVTTRLVSTADGFTTWSEVYDRQSADLFKMQDQVARAVVDALTTELGAAGGAAGAGGAPGSATAGAAGGAAGGRAVNAAPSTAPASAPAGSTPSSVGTSDPVAYDHYLHGRDLLQRRDPVSVQQALNEFQVATQRDSGFARAQAGLASAYAQLPASGDAVAAANRGLAAANVALKLDPSLAEGLTARGMLRATLGKFDEAQGDLQHAVSVDPNNALALRSLGDLRLVTGDVKGAVQVLTRAVLLDPGAPATNASVAMAYAASGALDTALSYAQRAVDADPSQARPHVVYGTLLLDAGRARDAIRELERAAAIDSSSAGTLGTLGAAYARAGDRTHAARVLAAIERKPTAPRAPSAIAKIRLALGDTALALTWLERAADAHDPALTTEPLTLGFWDPVRRDPRFAAVVRRVGLGTAILIQRSPGK